MDSNELGCSLEVICEGRSLEFNSVRMLFNRIDTENKRYIDQAQMRNLVESLGLNEDDGERTRRAISE